MGGDASEGELIDSFDWETCPHSPGTLAVSGIVAVDNDVAVEDKVAATFGGGRGHFFSLVNLLPW